MSRYQFFTLAYGLILGLHTAQAQLPVLDRPIETMPTLCILDIVASRGDARFSAFDADGYERDIWVSDSNLDTSGELTFSIRVRAADGSCSSELYQMVFPLHGDSELIDIRILDESGTSLGGLEMTPGTMPLIYDASGTEMAYGELGPLVLDSSRVSDDASKMLYLLLDEQVLNSLPVPTEINDAATTNWLEDLLLALAHSFYVGQREQLFSLIEFRLELSAMGSDHLELVADAIEGKIYDAGPYSGGDWWEDHPFISHGVARSAQVAAGSASETLGGFFNGHRNYMTGVEDHLRTLSGQSSPFGRLPVWDIADTIPDAFNRDGSSDGLLGSTSTSETYVTSASAANICASYDPSATGESTVSAQLSANESDLRNDINGWHGSVHVDISSDMGSVSTAARAPIFFPWHTTVDMPWRNWQVCWAGWNAADYDWPETY